MADSGRPSRCSDSESSDCSLSLDSEILCRHRHRHRRLNHGANKIKGFSNYYSFDNLCESLLIDIFSRLPCRTAAQLKLVCKFWNSLISSAYFVRVFNHRRHDPFSPATQDPESPPYRLLFVFHRHRRFRSMAHDYLSVAHCSSSGAVRRVDRVDLSFLPHRRIGVNASCDDLILCSFSEPPGSDWTTVFYVCNLRTRQWVHLPPALHPGHLSKDYIIGLLCDPAPCSLCLHKHGGCVDNNHDFKFMVVLIRKVKFHEGETIQGEPVPLMEMVLFSSEDGQWRSLMVPSPVDLADMDKGNVVPYKGKLHWLNEDHVLVYDPYNDPNKLSHVIKLQLAGYPYINGQSIGVFQGRLRVAYTTFLEAPIFHYVWELEDYDTGKWRLVHKLQGTDLNSTEEFILHDGNAFCMGENRSRVWLLNLQRRMEGGDHEFELVDRDHKFYSRNVDVYQIADLWWPTPVPPLTCYQGLIDWSLLLPTEDTRS
ncbi:unnamed protein product [Cuscuta campestris]|uniref:F-box domain-containing protein n=1 Tax=Cuscuta campestris TaxID=132261 RepID=A0A484MFN6_9ASTE|nr:unnamed protein product [Cuscuta campestris]VFQ87801.1 unnamed protein product [Cuscuta campestris]